MKGKDDALLAKEQKNKDDQYKKDHKTVNITLLQISCLGEAIYHLGILEVDPCIMSCLGEIIANKADDVQELIEQYMPYP